jgi:hypothetical protein
MEKQSLYKMQTGFDDEAAGITIRKLRHNHPALWCEARQGAASMVALIAITVLFVAALS